MGYYRSKSTGRVLTNVADALSEDGELVSGEPPATHVDGAPARVFRTDSETTLNLDALAADDSLDDTQKLRLISDSLFAKSFSNAAE